MDKFTTRNANCASRRVDCEHVENKLQNIISIEQDRSGRQRDDRWKGGGGRGAVRPCPNQINYQKTSLGWGGEREMRADEIDCEFYRVYSRVYAEHIVKRRCENC